AVVTDVVLIDNAEIMDAEGLARAKTISDASSNSSKTTHQKILEVPPDAAAADFKATRLAAHDSELVQRFEDIVTGWIGTIESTVLSGASSDAHSRDAIVGPLAELDKWRRRNRILTALTEQLKSKECKNIIGALIAAKSKVLKKWKAVDIAITDAVNDARDKLKYLDSLKKYLEDLYSPSVTPGFIINQTIPSALITMKQMDSASRYYSRSGFMGQLFNQVANQLVLCFKDYLRAPAGQRHDDQLWAVTLREARAARPEDFTDGPDRQIRAHFEQKLSQGRLHGKADIKEFDANAATLTGRIRACLLVQRLMRVALRHFRDSIGLGSHGGASASQASSQRAASAGAAAASATSGIPINDDDAILKHLDAFSTRLRQFLDVQASLSQMFRLAHTARKLPRPRKEDLEMDESESVSAAASAAAAATAAAASASSAAAAAAAGSSGHLAAIEEDNEQQSVSADGEDQQLQKQQPVDAAAHEAGNDEELLRSIALM
uniref:DHC_N1 domain-containing protein n=1 Tax=Macrostomum lignano TaxID=282301 RepID=A0A1I8IU51_9PLAT